MQTYLSERAIMGYSATTDDAIHEERVLPGVNVLPHKQLWADSTEIPAVLHDALVRRVNSIVEVNAEHDGVSFDKSGYPRGGGVVVKRARKRLTRTGTVSKQGFVAYAWDPELGAAIPPGACEGAGFVVEHARASDARNEVVGDAYVELDPRMHSVFVHASIAEPLFASFYAYVGRVGIYVPESLREEIPISMADADTFGVHKGPSVGIHRGDVIGNVRGYVDSLDNHRVIRASIVGEMHGHGEGTFQGELTGTFTGSAHIDGGEIARIDSLAVGRPPSTASPFVVRAERAHVRLESTADDATATLHVRAGGELYVDGPLAAVSANIGQLSTGDVRCATLTSLTGIRNSFAGVRDAGAVTGVSDIEVECGLYFGNKRFAPVDGAFRIVRDANEDGTPELVVQTTVNGVWTTVRSNLPSSSSGGQRIDPSFATTVQQRVRRANGARPVLVVGERLGEITVIAQSGTLLGVRVDDASASTYAEAANIIPFPENGPLKNAAIVTVDINTPDHKVWRGELVLRRGTRMQYGSVPYGNLDVLSVESAVAFPEVPFKLSMPDAKRAYRQAVRFHGGDDQFCVRDDFFAEIQTGCYVAKGARGSVEVSVVDRLPNRTLAPPPTAVTSAAIVNGDARNTLAVHGAEPGARLSVVADGEVVLIDRRLLDTVHSSHSIGPLFGATTFRATPSIVRVSIEHPEHRMVPFYARYEFRQGSTATASANGARCWSVLLATNWSQVPNAADVLVSFKGSPIVRAQVLRIPIRAMSPDATLRLDARFSDGTHRDDTSSYEIARVGDEIVVTYVGRRGDALVRIRSVVTSEH